MAPITTPGQMAALPPGAARRIPTGRALIRVPTFVRWPGKFEAGKTLNGIVTHQEWLPTLLAAAGKPNIVEKLKEGCDVGRQALPCAY